MSVSHLSIFYGQEKWHFAAGELEGNGINFYLLLFYAV